MENFGIPGLSYAGTEDPEPPIIVVEGGEKVGKSTTAISLVNWPKEGNYPLILAFDAAGVDSCAQMGYTMPCVKVKDQPGADTWQKTQSALTSIENAFRSKKGNFPFTSVVVDCGSTMTEKFWRDASKGMTNPGEKLQAYGTVLERSKEVMWRLLEIGVPTIWYTWIKEPFQDQKTKRQVLGGPLLVGNFKAVLSGKASQILLMEKVKTGGQGADAQGYVRQFHTKTHANIEAGGRYSQYLPDPCPPNLGWILTQIMTRGRGAPQFQQAAPVQQQAPTPESGEAA